jgi:DNA-binding transcriptional LysR family regulator
MPNATSKPSVAKPQPVHSIRLGSSPVIGGIGLTLGSDWMFTPELASGEVVSVLDDWRLSDTALWAVFPSGRMQSAKARAFADFVAAQVS